MTGVPDDDLSDAALDALRRLSIDGLRKAWRARFQDAPPQVRSRDLFVRAYVHRLEARRAGGSPNTHRKRLLALAERFAADENYSPGARSSVAPGTVFVRDWHGVRHVVFATADGFKHGDKTYTSLSAVAFAITGTKWNGPRFFRSTAPEKAP
jgi:hypothetical protein